MKHRTFPVLFLALLLALSVGLIGAAPTNTVAAQGEPTTVPLEDFTQLADYFPEGAATFAAIRTDQGYRDQLNLVLATLADSIPELAGLNIDLILNLLSQQVFGAPYGETIEPWLGDSIAISLMDTGAIVDLLLDVVTIADVQTMPGEPGMGDDMGDMGDMDMEPVDPMMEIISRLPAMLAFDVTDTEAARFFLSQGIDLNPADMEVEGFDVRQNGPIYFLFDDANGALLVTSAAGIAALDFDAPLSESDAFTSVIGEMPVESYNIFLYADVPAISDQLLDGMESFAALLEEQAGDDPMGAATLDSLRDGIDQARELDVFGPQAIGFTIIDGRSLTIDLLSFRGEDGLLSDLELAPIDPDFARFIPADTQLVIHDNGYGPEMLAIFEELDRVGPALQSLIDMLLDSGALDDDPEGAAMLEMLRLDNINLGGLIEVQVNTLFGGFTGLNLTRDVLSWMTGDYAFTTRLIPVESELDFTIDMAFLTEVTDPAAAQTVVQGLIEAAETYRANAAVETIGGVDALVYFDPVRAIFPPDFAPEVIAATPELDIVIGANDEVYVVGSRPSATFALDPQGESLLDNPTYAYAAENLFLKDATAVWYVGVPPFVDALPALLEAAPAEDLFMVAQLATLLESATISSSGFEGGAVTRLTLTLEDEPVIPEALLPSMEDGDMDADMDAEEDADMDMDTDMDAEEEDAEPAATEEAGS